MISKLLRLLDLAYKIWNKVAANVDRKIKRSNSLLDFINDSSIFFDRSYSRLKVTWVAATEGNDCRRFFRGIGGPSHISFQSRTFGLSKQLVSALC